MKPQVVILTAGESSRFYPFNTRHKSLFYLCGKPIISHLLNSIVRSGLHEVIIVQNPDRTIESELQPYQPATLNITYVTQESARGMGSAILTAAPHIHSDFFVVNAQHLLFDKQAQIMLQAFEKHSPLAVMLRSQTTTPEKFGIYQLDKDRVISVEERPSPAQALSNWRVVGTYLFRHSFLELLKNQPQNNHQLEKVITHAARSNLILALPTIIDIPSLKYVWDLFAVKDTLFQILPAYQDDYSFISKTAVITGKVIVEAGARIHDFAVIEGPAYIGRDAVVGRFCQLRNGTILEERAQVERYCDVRNSMIGIDTHIHSQFIGDSIIQDSCRIGAGFITANTRLDRDSIYVALDTGSVNTQLTRLGVIMASQVKIGVSVSTMPGTILNHNTTIGPGLTIKGTIPANTLITKSNT